MNPLAGLVDGVKPKPMGNAVRCYFGICCPHCDEVFQPAQLAGNFAEDDCPSCGESFYWTSGKIWCFKYWQSASNYIVNEDGSKTPC